LVLAAGLSSRMGRDKALLAAPEGGTMWERQRDVLNAAGAVEVFLSARPEQTWVRGATGFAAILHDALPGCGPLVGITAALERNTRTRHVAVLGIDLPGLPAAWFRRLHQVCEDEVGAVGVRDGRFEPLAAIYARPVMFTAWEALARGDYALQPLLGRAVSEGRMRVVEIGPAEAAWFENWNEPRGN
jgi:molybdopterin-guanine dinucleotide biosynthesis protein A